MPRTRVPFLSRSLVTLLIVTSLAGLLNASVAEAQALQLKDGLVPFEGDRTVMASLRAAVKPGQLVVVTEDSGHETKGIVRELTDVALTLEGKAFPASSIYAVRQTDPLGNGTLAGMGVGIGATVAFAATCGRYEFSEERGLCQAAAVTSALLVVPLAAFIGRQIDRAVGDRELYRRPVHRVVRASLSPVWQPTGLGIQLSVAVGRVP
jgi:hypothetical protein